MGFSVLVSLQLWSSDLEYFNWAIFIFSYEQVALLNLIKLGSSDVYISNRTSKTTPSGNKYTPLSMVNIYPG